MPAETVLRQETRSRLQAQHADTIQRAVAAEAILLGMMSESTGAATRRLIDEVHRGADGRDEEERVRALRVAIHQQSGQLDDELWDSILRGRKVARELAQGQAGYELELIGYYSKTHGMGWNVPAAPPSVWDSQEYDELSATIATGSAVSQWASAMMLGALLWERDGGTVESRLRQAGQGLSSKLVGHASYQAFDAYGREHESIWTELAGIKDDWALGTYRVWTAFLDGRVCHACWMLDAQMVPLGTPFEGGAQAPLHNRCRCAVVTMFIPEASRKRLPGIQTDYQVVKAELRDLMKTGGAAARGALAATNPPTPLNITDRSALRYIRAAVQDTPGIRPGLRQSRAETLLKRLNDMQRRPIGSLAGSTPPKLYLPPGPRGAP